MTEEQQEVFADGIGQIHFAEGMVRFDFITLQPGEEGKPPIPQSSIRVIMPPQGFLNAFNSMQQLMDKILDVEIQQKRKQKAAKAVKTAKTAKTRSSSKKTSAKSKRAR